MACATETDPVVLQCPSSRPAAGDGCDEAAAGLSCNYDDECEQLITLECDGSAWVVQAQMSCTEPCPASLPDDGQSCIQIGLSCEYGLDPMEECIDFGTCTSTGWERSCRTPECPEAIPEAGEPCTDPEEFAGACAYTVDTPCGPQERVLTCDWNGVALEWAIVQEPTC